MYKTILTGRTYQQFAHIEGSQNLQTIKIDVAFSQETDQMTTIEDIVSEAVMGKVTEDNRLAS